MLVVNVDIRVKAEWVGPFIAATVENARQSVLEPGIVRFDVLQDRDDPTHFTLVEIYRTSEATAAHKETAHYLKWRDTVANMMSTPRTSTKYDNVFPADAEL